MMHANARRPGLATQLEKQGQRATCLQELLIGRELAANAAEAPTLISQIPYAKQCASIS